MNLPLINNDNAGNSYFGWRSNTLIYAPDSAGVLASQLVNWINGFFGETCAIVNVQSSFNIIFPASFETLSRPATEGKYRFSNFGFSSSNNNALTAVIGYPLNVQLSDFGSWDFAPHFTGSSNRVLYGVLNNRSLSLFLTGRNGANINNSNYAFMSMGWLSNPLYSGSAFPRNAYCLVLSSQNQRVGARPSAENTSSGVNFQIPTGTTADPIANYSIACQTATPGANTTELYLRDNVAPNKAIGYVPNVLKTNLQIPIGQIYLNTALDPDGSIMNTWICVGIFGSERILMRVWTGG